MVCACRNKKDIFVKLSKINLFIFFVKYRINLGGSRATWFMQRLLQLKYPHHATQITLTRAQVSRTFYYLLGSKSRNKWRTYSVDNLHET